MFLKCMGKNRVGFLSGAPYEATLNGEPSKRPMRGRIAFGVGGLMFIVFTLTLIFLGFGNLQDTTDELSSGAQVSFKNISVFFLPPIVLSMCYSAELTKPIGLNFEFRIYFCTF